MNYFKLIYYDYFAPNRLNILEKIYIEALNHGYKIVSVIDFWDIVRLNKFNVKDKYLINRHDIDSDPKCVKLILQIEKNLGISSSYYFRLRTIDLSVIKSVIASGREVGYHYEELATLAYKYKWKKKTDINWNLTKKLFSKNFTNFKNLTGYEVRSICSHGDFINRFLNIPNYKIISEKLKKDLKIDIEVYEDAIWKYNSIQHSDIHSKCGFTPYSPISSIKQSLPIIHLLTHPRQLRVNWKENAIDNIDRICRGIFY
jgi:hypothetical protein